MNGMKKALLASGMTLILSTVLLVGTTFAVFTGSVSKNGKITAADEFTEKILKMEWYGYDCVESVTESGAEAGTTVTIDSLSCHFASAGQRLSENHEVRIDETNFDPTKIYAKLYEVKNEGMLDFKCKFDFFNSVDGGLGDKLWFDLVPLTDENNMEREINKKKLAEIASYLDDDTEGTIIEKGNSKKYVFVCGLQDGQTADSFKENDNGYYFFNIEVKTAKPDEQFQIIPQEGGNHAADGSVSMGDAGQTGESNTTEGSVSTGDAGLTGENNLSKGEEGL